MAQERFFEPKHFIVSKTDLRGVITYANQSFLDVAMYTQMELIGRPHSMIRHPDMPRCVFHLLWQTIQSGEEIFAYVKNQCKNGDYYWVLAYVTPEFHPKTKEVIGYDSFRRVPSRRAIEEIELLYDLLLKEERKFTHKKKAIEASTALLLRLLEDKGVSYKRFILDLIAQHGN